MTIAFPAAPQIQKRTGPLGQLGNMAMNKGLQMGINAAIPGGGFAAEAAQQILPGMMPYFNEGGSVWGSMKNAYGKILPGMIAEGAGSLYDQLPSQEDLGLDPASRALAKQFWMRKMGMGDGAQYRNHGGGVHGEPHPQEKQYQMDHKHHLTGVTEYKKAGGRVGPLAKTVMKDMDGNTSERHYHNPIQKPAGGSDK